mmetsp:Transcript_3134/g.7712  ORF Transcript_3134/g.7712 Transcript_3134/m.7712 type:complete len:242 (-) Transcript_3134:499-1224(-)
MFHVHKMPLARWEHAVPGQLVVHGQRDLGVRNLLDLACVPRSLSLVGHPERKVLNGVVHVDPARVERVLVRVGTQPQVAGHARDEDRTGNCTPLANTVSVREVAVEGRGQPTPLRLRRARDGLCEAEQGVGAPRADVIPVHLVGACGILLVQVDGREGLHHVLRAGVRRISTRAIDVGHANLQPSCLHLPERGCPVRQHISRPAAPARAEKHERARLRSEVRRKVGGGYAEQMRFDLAVGK